MSSGAAIVDMLETGSTWWEESWADWSPPRKWRALALPDGWDQLDGSVARD